MATWVDKVRLQFEDAASAPYAAAGKKIGGTNSEMKKSAFDLQTAIKALAGAWITQKAISFVGQGISEAIDAEKASLRLGATLRATGKDAQMSADGVNALAQSLADKSTFDDDAIAGAQALLLEFDNISAKSLPRVTRAILDLAARTGDLTGSTLMVGKALQGEQGSLMALGKAGIKFNEETQKNIDMLRAHGRAADADEIILAKLEGRIGGVDAALAAGGNGLIQNSKRWVQLKEDIGAAIIESDAFVRTMDTVTILLGKTRAMRPIELMDAGQVKTTIGLINEAVEAKNTLDADVKKGMNQNSVAIFKQWEDASAALRQYVGDFKTLEEVKTRLKTRELEIPAQEKAGKEAKAAADAEAAREAAFKAAQASEKSRMDAAKAAAEKAAADEVSRISALDAIRDENLKLTHDGRLRIIKEQYAADLQLAKDFEPDILQVTQKRDAAILDEETKNAEAQIALAEKTLDEKKALADKEKEIANARAGYVLDVAQTYGEALKMVVGSNKKGAAALKAIGMFEAGVNGARAVLQAMTLSPPVAAFAVPAAILAAGVQTAKIATAKFAAGGFPSGRGSMIQVNEMGQESVLNSRATSRLGVAGVTALNSGAPYPGRTTNEISYAPVYHFAGGAAPDILAALENDKNRFASFLNRLQKKGYLATAGAF
jgi:hypothetical protein